MCLFHDIYFKAVPWLLLHEKIEVFTHSVAVTQWHRFKGGWGHFYTVTCILKNGVKHCQHEFCSWTNSDNAPNCSQEYRYIRSSVELMQIQLEVIFTKLFLTSLRSGLYQKCQNSSSRPYYLGGHKVGANGSWLLVAAGQSSTRHNASIDTVMGTFLGCTWPQPYPLPADSWELAGFWTLCISVTFCWNQLH